MRKQTLAARYGKDSLFWLKFHRNAAYMATTTTVPLAATAFSLTDAAPTSAHHIIGSCLCACICGNGLVVSQIPCVPLAIY